MCALTAELDRLREQVEIAVRQKKADARELDELAAENARLREQLRELREALEEITYIASQRKIGGPRMDGSQQWSSPYFGRIYEIARAALSRTEADRSRPVSHQVPEVVGQPEDQPDLGPGSVHTEVDHQQRQRKTPEESLHD